MESQSTSIVDMLNFSAADYAQSLLKHLNDQRQQNEFCDIKLIIDGQEFAAHKAILSSASPYFHAMFGGSMVESSQSTVVIHEIESIVFNVILDYIYSGGFLDS